MASPSEFLTFYRRTGLSLGRGIQASARTPALVRVASPLATRPFSVSSQFQKKYPEDLSTNEKTKTELYPDDEHSTKKAAKGDTLDVQTANLKDAQDSAKATGTGGHATEQRDSAGGKEKAKREHPEAPDPAIGMQDERGGRGG